eukprot:GHVT01082578.1.p1 GENE.GHVT01082578.1~~GHVT01082578.1.p1  ORF type:complete len:109 (-),score=11.19 GHVT01082578.1:526-852(-)
MSEPNENNWLEELLKSDVDEKTPDFKFALKPDTSHENAQNEFPNSKFSGSEEQDVDNLTEMPMPELPDILQMPSTFSHPTEALSVANPFHLEFNKKSVRFRTPTMHEL